MARYDIQRFLQEQQAWKARELPLLEAFYHVRDAVFDTLAQFAQDASEAGLEGVQPPEKPEPRKGITQATVQINYLDLTFISADLVLELVDDHGNTRPTARILVYPRQDAEALPFLDVVVFEMQQDKYCCNVRAFNADGKAFDLAAPFPATPGGGSEIAQEIIDFCYGFSRPGFWPEQVTFDDTQKSRDTPKAIMLSPADIANQEALLATYRQTLAIELQRQAHFGAAHTPPDITHNIREARSSIVRIKATLRASGVDAADRPDDSEG